MFKNKGDYGKNLSYRKGFADAIQHDLRMKNWDLIPEKLPVNRTDIPKTHISDYTEGYKAGISELKKI